MSGYVLGLLTDDVERSDGSGVESGILRTTTLSASYEAKYMSEAAVSGPAAGMQRGRKLKRFSAG